MHSIQNFILPVQSRDIVGNMFVLKILLQCIYFILFINLCTTQNYVSQCATKESCSACIRESGCVWCSRPHSTLMNGTSFTRCVNLDNSRKSDWCAEKNIVNPQTNGKIIQNIPLQTSNKGGAVQISPQRVRLTLRRGEEYKLNFTYAQAEDYPVDLYYVMDLSASMEQHRDKLSKLGFKLADTMKKLTRNFRLGFGSFVDKTEMPFVSTVKEKLETPCKLNNKPCDPPYGFKNHLSLTEDTNIFSEQVKIANVSGNLDAPEGGLDALMQSIVCQKQIGWRTKARHLLVFSTDAGFHIAGDGKLAGIVEPNDGLCHMENNYYTHSLLLDYPSIAQINAKAIEHNINVIFAVVKSQEEVYKGLRDRIKEASIGTLSNDSSNVVELVKSVYNQLVDSVTISDNSESNIEVKYYSTCLESALKETKECGNLRVGVQVNFTAIIKVLDCPKDDNLTRIFQIKPGALNESLTVEVNMLCDCSCEKPGNPGFVHKSSECKYVGNLQCGICKCEQGKFGSNCECDGQNSTNVEDFRNCRMDNSSEICSGLGTCKCGICDCQKRADPSEVIRGKYCECNNYSCKRSGNQLCSGPTRGTCECGVCVCMAGWGGDACECPDNNNTCIAKDSNGTICSARGECKCGQCECAEKDGYRYSGQYCDECPTCSGQRCEEFRHCVECQAHKTGIYDEDMCKLHCTAFDVEIIDKIETQGKRIDSNEKICSYPDKSRCTFIFKYTYDDSKELRIYAQRDKICSPIVNVLAVVLGVIGSILLVGFLTLLMWKILTTLHDRREYAKFENERKNARWNRGENPLFKNPTSTFQNPTYSS